MQPLAWRPEIAFFSLWRDGELVTDLDEPDDLVEGDACRAGEHGTLRRGGLVVASCRPLDERGRGRAADERVIGAGRAPAPGADCCSS